MNSTASTPCVIEANADVSGTGIRASIYALCLGGRIFSFIIQSLGHEKDSKEFDRSVKSALSIQGMALLCTAIYQTFRVQITLFHAICVLHLMALLGINVAAKGEYSGNERYRKWFEQSFKVFLSCVFIAFNVYIWAKAPHFGSQPECNRSTLYVVFGVSIHATSPVFRWLSLGTLSAFPAGFSTFLLLYGSCFLAGWCCGCVEQGSPPFYDLNSGYSDESKDDWIRPLVKLVAYTSFSIYAVVSLEQTIHRNTLEPEERDWTFGQLIALFLLLGMLNEIINVMVAMGDRRQTLDRGEGLRSLRP